MRLTGILLAASCLAGCFTEVGNAEDERLVEARFRVDYSPPAARLKAATAGTAAIQRFYLAVGEAEFHLLDSATNRRADYHIWKSGTSVLRVDFTGLDTAATLPPATVGGIDPLDMKLECRLPAAKALRPDTLDFAGFRDDGYIKGHYWDGRDSTGFLFALSSGGNLNLIYPKAAVQAWYANGRYDCEFVFYANKWIAAADLSAAVRVADRAGRRIILLDSAHNANAFAALTAAFTKSFNAPTVMISQGR